MKRIQTTTAAVFAAFALAGAAGTTWATIQSAPPNMKSQTNRPPAVGEKANLSQADQTFLQEAAQINANEIALGKIAERQSTDPNIRKIAQDLVRDHTGANQQLEQLAHSKGITVPTQLSPGQEKNAAALQAQTGDQFNKQYLQNNIKGHEKAISLFEKVAQRTTDPEIKAWTEKMIPELKAHLAMVQSGKPEAVGEHQRQKSPLKYH